MKPRPAAREASQAPWRPSIPQRHFLGALFEPSGNGLLTWARWQEGRPLDPGIIDLLPLAYRRLAVLEPGTDVARRAREAYLETARDNLPRIGRLLGALGRLSEAGIGAVVIKGAALALRYYRSYGARPMVDLDLLVRPADVDRAVALLGGLGWAAAGDLAPHVQRVRTRIHHALTLTSGPSDSLDLHWRLAAGVRPDVTEMMWEASEAVDVESISLRVLNRTDQLFHVLVHAVQPDWHPSPRWMADACVVLDAGEPPVQWDRLLAMASRAAMTARLRAALLDLDRLAPGRVPGEVLEALSSAAVDHAQSRELAMYARLPPYRITHILGWHWYLFRRLRETDRAWQRRPALMSFADYVRLRMFLRRRR